MKCRLFLAGFLVLSILVSMASAETAIKQLYFTKKTPLTYPALKGGVKVRQVAG